MFHAYQAMIHDARRTCGHAVLLVGTVRVLDCVLAAGDAENLCRRRRAFGSVARSTTAPYEVALYMIDRVGAGPARARRIRRAGARASVAGARAACMRPCVHGMITDVLISSDAGTSIKLYV